jgi:hypothetical protein
MARKTHCSLDFQIRGSLLSPPLFVVLYKEFVSSEKIGIQIWQNSITPKNSQIFLLEVGVRIELKACFLIVPRCLWPWEVLTDLELSLEIPCIQLPISGGVGPLSL